MAVDIQVSVEAGFFRRWMTVKKLREALAELKDNDILTPNRVGNLSVMRDTEQTMIGYIDFQSEDFVSISEAE